MENFKTFKDFSRHTDLELVGQTNEVTTGLTGNPDYLTPSPSIVALTTAKTEFESAITAAANGDVQLVAVKNEKRAILTNLLQREAIYVELNGQNVKSVMLSSGFKVYSTVRGVTPVSDKPLITRVKDGGITGEVILKSNKVKYAVVYEVRFTSDDYGPNAVWTRPTVQTSKTFFLSGLTPGRTYWFQMRTISTKGASDWSDPFEYMVR